MEMWLPSEKWRKGLHKHNSLQIFLEEISTREVDILAKVLASKFISNCLILLEIYKPN